MASYKQSTLSSFFQLATLLFTLITVCAGAPHIHSHVARDASPEDNLAPRATNPGVHVSNKASTPQTLVFYQNDANGYGQSSSPGQTIKLGPNENQFVSLPVTWKGHIQRGTELPATWVEFQVASDNAGGASWGNISLEQGCDGGATIQGDGAAFGFSKDIVSGAPAAAVRNKPNGQKALDTTMGGWVGTVLAQPNQATINYENQQVGQSQAYIVGGTGTQVANSASQSLTVNFY